MVGHPATGSGTLHPGAGSLYRVLRVGRCCAVVRAMAESLLSARERAAPEEGQTRTDTASGEATRAPRYQRRMVAPPTALV